MKLERKMKEVGIKYLSYTNQLQTRASPTLITQLPRALSH